MNTPQEKILMESSQVNDFNAGDVTEVHVSPFCLRNSVENLENHDNKENFLNSYSFSFLSFFSNILYSFFYIKRADSLKFETFNFEERKGKPIRMEEEAFSLNFIMPNHVFRSPMRSLSFEENADFITAEFKPNAKPLTKCPTELTLLDTNENDMNPDIPTISCYTVKELQIYKFLY